MRSVCRYTITFGIIIIAATAHAQNEQNREEPGFGADPRVSTGPIAPLLENLGTHTMPVTTSVDRARTFFNQGLSLAYAFNHNEAKRAFQEAIRLDPEFTMGFWGWALVLGPNINRPMPAADGPEATNAIQEALKLSANASGLEKDLINALAKRYVANPGDDRSGLDQDYNRAMADLYAKYPNDPDVGTLYAASVMNLMPWAYWSKDRKPRPQTQHAMEVLEKVIADDADHTGARHYYIHIVEEHYPTKAEEPADELIELAPGSGHLLHMPSHIYMRVGRYDSAFESNRLAVLADEGYLTACRQQGIYPMSYYPHNVHFLSWAAQREGRSADAIAGARKVGAKALESESVGADFALHQSFMSQPIYVLIRFGKWTELLQVPTPHKDYVFARGLWHLGRGIAYANSNRHRQAQEELKELKRLMETTAAEEEFVGFANAQSVLRLASDLLAGEIAVKRGNFDDALPILERAVRLEDGMVYNEPPDWPLPIRHSLGAALLEAGRADEAETVYWEDLKRNPDNGFALFGLHQALKTQGNEAGAADVWTRFEEAWAKADFDLTSSRY